MPVYRPRRVGSYYFWQHAVAGDCELPYVLPQHFWDLLSCDYSGDHDWGIKLYRSQQDALDALRRVLDRLHSQLADAVVWDRRMGSQGDVSPLELEDFRSSALAKLTPIEREALRV